MKRVLITVSGGVADYVADEGVAVEIYDFDNQEDDPDSGVPQSFADLAEQVGAPVEWPPTKPAATAPVAEVRGLEGARRIATCSIFTQHSALEY